jgi:hypothetical protein
MYKSAVLLVVCVWCRAALAADDQQTECARLLAAEPPNVRARGCLHTGMQADDEQGQRALFLCQLHESSVLLNHLSTLVNEGVDGLLGASGRRGQHVHTPSDNRGRRRHQGRLDNGHRETQT